MTRTRSRTKKTTSVSKSLESLKRAKSGEEKRTEQITDDEEDLENQDDSDLENKIEEVEKKRKERDFVVDDDGFGYGERSDAEDEVDDYSGEEAEEQHSRRTLKKKKTDENSKSKKKSATTGKDKEGDSKKAATAEKKKKKEEVPQNNKMDQFLNRTNTTGTSSKSTTSTSTTTTSSTTSTSLSERLQKSNSTKSGNEDALELYLNDLMENPNEEMDLDSIEEQKHQLELLRQKQEEEEKEKEKEEEEKKATIDVKIENDGQEDEEENQVNEEEEEQDVKREEEEEGQDEIKKEDNTDDFVFDFDAADVQAQPVQQQKPTTAKKVQNKQIPIKSLSNKPIKISTVSPKATNDWWGKAQAGGINLQSFESYIVKDISNIPSLKSKDGLQFYYLHASEGENNGNIYLFGKVSHVSNGVETFKSCCVVVEGMKRNIFLLPRDYILDENGDSTTKEPTEELIRNEVSKLMSSQKIKDWELKQVKRTICFDYTTESKNQSIGEYKMYKLSYPAVHAPLKNEISGSTFSAAYGITSSPLELFLMKSKIMGPSWLLLNDFKPVLNLAEKTSWCRLEGKLASYKQVKPMVNAKLKLPSVVVMSMAVKTVNSTTSPEIVMISMVIHDSVSIDGATPEETQSKVRYLTAMRPLNKEVLPPEFNKDKKSNIVIFQKESELLSYFANVLMNVDPDVLAGHNITNFDLDVLLHRMKDFKIMDWSYIGRLRKRELPRLSSNIGSGENQYQERAAVTGRLICDTYLLCQEFLLKEKSYKLVEICKSQLNLEKEEINFSAVDGYFANTLKLNRLVELNEQDCYAIFQLIFKLLFLPLTKQLTNIAGNLWNRSLSGNKAERIEYLLLHSFYAKKYILPDKLYKKDKDFGKKKSKYGGGLVLEPKANFYDRYIVLLDFNSLYPSIIQEFNVCFTTIERKLRSDGNRSINGGFEEAQPPSSTVSVGILPTVLKGLVNKRKEVKRDLGREKDKLIKQQLDIKQQAIKLVANSMYGCLGYRSSRFYALPLAELVTRKGRENLQKSADVVKQMNYDVIYGDTDSLMIYTGVSTYVEAEKIGFDIKDKVNRQYRGSVMEIGLDGIFKRMLLLRKKKYAALIETREAPDVYKTEIQNKGIDIVRRDWCGLTKEIGNNLLKMILSPDDTVASNIQLEIKQYIESMATKMKASEIPVDSFIIIKSLSSAPESYNDADSQPHVQVALQMKAKGELVQQGDQIPYVIIKGDEDWAKRARHPKDLENNSELIDLDWYLSQQIHPPLYRLLALLEVDEENLATYLGMSSRKYKSNKSKQDRDESDFTIDTDIYRSLESDSRFSKCSKPHFNCPSCKSPVEFKGVSVISDKPVKLAIEGFTCTKESCKMIFSLPVLKNQLNIILRNLVKTHQTFLLRCKECGDNKVPTKQYRQVTYRCISCPGGMNQILDSSSILKQLEYYKNIFSTKRIRDRFGDLEGQFEYNQIKCLNDMESMVDKILSRHKGYSCQINNLFSDTQTDGEYFKNRPWLKQI